MKLDDVCTYELSQYGEANEISSSIQLKSVSTLPKISRFVILKRSDSFSLSAISRLSCETVDKAILWALAFRINLKSCLEGGLPGSGGQRSLDKF